MSKGSSILANGLFLETLFASLITRKTYVCKVPGDIVWERARNSEKTKLNVDDFQNQRISWRYQIFRWLYSKSLKRARKVIVPSTHLYDLCVLWGVKQEYIHLIYNSVDIHKFSPGKSATKKFDVLVVNRLVSWKHVDEVISVCSQLDLSLAVIGDGPEKPYLEKVALDSRARVTFLGELSQDELPSWVRSAECFVLNSSFEATSYSLLEARASGLFCIANGSTGSDEVINHEIDGLLCDKLSLTLMDALSRFKTDKKFVQKAGSLSILDARNRFNQSTNFRIIKELLL
jgi:glycosyltransferase involved in cell wall biosynthesis